MVVRIHPPQPILKSGNRRVWLIPFALEAKAHWFESSFPDHLSSIRNTMSRQVKTETEKDSTVAPTPPTPERFLEITNRIHEEEYDDFMDGYRQAAKETEA
jgi:hypothetical protein